ncbi:MAG TPA: EndoU domain-containing protein, partial [Candidatus Babeliaceae bacterium]|nr:EndoU domain-containing protein [Candidatus Babeliaceae bacterium]
AVEQAIYLFERYPIMEVQNLAAKVLICTDVANKCNRLGMVDQGFKVIDLAHNLASFACTYGAAVAEGFVDGVCRFFKKIFDPISTAKELVHSAAATARSLARVIYTFAELDYLREHDPEKFSMRAFEVRQNIQQLGQVFADKINNTPGPEIAKEAVAFAIEALIPAMCSGIAKTFITAAKEQKVGPWLATALENLTCEEKAQVLLQTPDGVIVAEAIQEVEHIAQKHVLKATAASPSSLSRGCGLLPVCGNQKHRFIPDDIIQHVPDDQEFAELRMLYDNKIIAPQELGSCLFTVNYEHIFLPDITCLKNGLKPSGFHHDLFEKIKQGGAILFDNVKQLKNGVYRANWSYKGQSKSSTFFPKDWDRKKVVEKILEAAQNPTKKEARGGGWKLKGITKEGIDIEILVDNKGFIDSAYPIA